MSSPGASGPPLDPPSPGAPTTESEQHQAQQHSSSAPAGTATPTTSAPLPDDASAPPQTEATAAAASESAANRTPPPPPQNPGQTAGRRPLSSYTIIQPIGGRPDGEDGQDDGNRIVLTWTIELFPNDGQETPNADTTGEVAVPNIDDEAAAEGDAAGGENETANAGERAPPAGFNPAAFFPPPGAPGAAADGERGNTLFFMIGPDGRVIPRPGGTHEGQPPPFVFPFPLPFTFGPPPPAPDPAKAAELLASLPTVGRALLRRVDKIVAAEDAAGGKEYDERGWRCGICLEGLESEAEHEDPDQTVKGLPCNHLFHEECLQPWFTTHHTCPTCRLDLDPLRTLHPPRETRTNPLRPAATGSGRGTPAGGAHPYARDGRQRSGRQTPANVNANANAAGDGVQGQTPAAPGTPVNGPDRIPTPQSILESLVSQVTQAAFGAAMRNNQLFDNPITASPVPIERPEGGAGAAAPRDGSPAPAGPSAAPTAQTPAAELGGNEGEGAGAAASPATARADMPRPTPERRPHIHFINIPRRPMGARNPDVATPGAGGPPTAADAPTSPLTGPGPAPARGDRPRHLHLPLEFLFFTPQAHPLGDDALGQERPAGPPGAPAAHGADATAAAATPSSPVTTFVPQTLESWTEQREKTLGWRCDAIECLVAPPIPGSGAEDMDVDDSAGDESELSACDKGMLSIYAPTQVPFDTEAAPDTTAAPGTANYVLLACEHRWHRACLETAERSAGHTGAPDAEGHEWVRCPRCRKQGWITPRGATPSVAATTTVNA